MVKGQQVWVARVYVLEGHDHLDELLQIIHEEEGIANVHAFRAVAGTAGGREVHTSSLLTLSLRLPLMVEFFGEEKPVEAAIGKLQSRLGLEDILVWPATKLASQMPGGAEPSPHPAGTDQ
ncbi:MAG: hypothetical protein Kow0060_22660 [Methylohalobius crimeensis]